jgi:hypothetical protein
MRRIAILLAAIIAGVLVSTGVGLAASSSGSQQQTSSNPDHILGEEGNDLLVDAPEREFATDIVSAGEGNNVVGAVNRPAFEDIVTCGGFDRVIVDRKDMLAPDCEKVFFGFGSEDEFIASIPQSFFEGLHPQFMQFLRE